VAVGRHAHLGAPRPVQLPLRRLWRPLVLLGREATEAHAVNLGAVQRFGLQPRGPRQLWPALGRDVSEARAIVLRLVHQLKDEAANSNEQAGGTTLLRAIAQNQS